MLQVVGAGVGRTGTHSLKLALEQKICPLSGEPLGSMGVPIKVESKGHTLFICCAGCEGPVKKDPEKYLAKLKGKKSEK